MKELTVDGMTEDGGQNEERASRLGWRADGMIRYAGSVLRIGWTAMLKVWWWKVPDEELGRSNRAWIKIGKEGVWRGKGFSAANTNTGAWGGKEREGRALPDVSAKQPL